MSSNTLKTAKKFANRFDLSVIPIPIGQKKASIKWKSFQSRKATDNKLNTMFDNGDSNIAVVTGKLSNVIVFDADDKKAVKYLEKLAPNTPTVKTPSGGIHKYFLYEEGIKNKVRLNGKKIDVRSEGGYAIVYRFAKGKSFDNYSPAPIPKELLKLIKQDSKKRNDFQTKDIWHGAKKGSRNDSMTQVVGHLVRTHYPNLNKIRKEALEVNVSYQPPLTTGEVETIFNSICNAEQNKRKKPLKHEVIKNDFKPRIFTANELGKMKLKKPFYIVDEIITPSLTLLCGKPKVGKSLLALCIAVAVATGDRALGQLKTKKGDVLALLLEDNESGLKERLQRILQIRPYPENLHLATDWLKLDEGGLEHIEEELDKNKKIKLLIIDTLQRIRPRPNGRKNSTLYSEDYEALVPLKKIADQRGIAVIVIHHLRKSNSEDKIDLVSGTLGLSGSADNVLILQKKGRGGELYTTGRNIPDQSFAVEFDTSSLTWRMLGDLEETRMSEGRQEIINLLHENVSPLSPKSISELLNKKSGNIRALLYKMYRDDQVIKNDDDKYTVNSNNTGNSDDTDNSDNE